MKTMKKAKIGSTQRERLANLEKCYAVTSNRFLSLAERSRSAGVFVSNREVDEVQKDLNESLAR